MSQHYLTYPSIRRITIILTRIIITHLWQNILWDKGILINRREAHSTVLYCTVGKTKMEVEELTCFKQQQQQQLWVVMTYITKVLSLQNNRKYKSCCKPIRKQATFEELHWNHPVVLIICKYVLLCPFLWVFIHGLQYCILYLTLYCLPTACPNTTLSYLMPTALNLKGV